MDKANNVHFEADFDADGNTTGIQQTPWGKAAQKADVYRPKDASTLDEWDTQQDMNGHTYPAEVKVYEKNGRLRVHLKFNEHGIAFYGEVFDATGNRTGGFLDPREETKYSDPAGALAQVPRQQLARTTCGECQSEAEERNKHTLEMNRIAYEMNDLAERFARKNKYAAEQKMFDRALPLLRSRYEHLDGIWREKKSELDALTSKLITCDKLCDKYEFECSTTTLQ
ncbi:MAG: hypothetical protein JRJ85_08540, partial [Deltaproteobacteria bacterium]|nr:hypothetical protein [Deltaproteobacteria bacterium]